MTRLADDEREIRVHPGALEEIRSLRRAGRASLAERIVEKIEHLAGDPYRPRPGMDIKKIRGTNDPVYRLRVGDHRVIHEVDEEASVVYVTQIVKRGDAHA